MRHDILYSPETSALLLAMTALQTVRGVPAREALDRAYEIWDRHEARSWEASELIALVDQLSGD
ncbi:hypothetical protein [Mycobacterium sp. ZZG]